MTGESDSCRVAPARRRDRSGGAALAVVVQATDVRYGRHRAGGTVDLTFLRGVLSERQVRAPIVVVGKIGSKDTAERSFVPDNDVVHALPMQRADDALDERVLPRGMRRNHDLLDAEGSNGRAKGVPVDAVAVTEHEPGRVGRRPGLAKLLGRPRGRRVGGHIRVRDSSAVVAEHDEHEEHAERRRGHGEEVDRRDLGGVIRRKRPPSLRGWRRSPTQVLGHGGLRDVEPELQHLAVNTRCPPGGGPSIWAAVQRDAATSPTSTARIRDGATGRRCPARRTGRSFAMTSIRSRATPPDEAIDGPQAKPCGCLTSKDGQLVPEGEDLERQRST
jgi:hypothetical protein